jgi:hypothetical protein
VPESHAGSSARTAITITTRALVMRMQLTHPSPGEPSWERCQEPRRRAIALLPVVTRTLRCEDVAAVAGRLLPRPGANDRYRAGS